MAIPLSIMCSKWNLIAISLFVYSVLQCLQLYMDSNVEHSPAHIVVERTRSETGEKKTATAPSKLHFKM